MRSVEEISKEINMVEQGDTETLWNQACEYEHSGNMTEAVNLYRKAAENGHSEAQFLLAERYRMGLGMERDFAKAAKWYQKAAEQGNVAACIALGTCYFKGEGVNQDYEKALYFYSVSSSDCLPAENMAECYRQCKNIPDHMAQAEKWQKRTDKRKDAIDDLLKLIDNDDEFIF